MKLILIIFYVLAAGPAPIEIESVPELMGYSIGMSLEQARKLLAVQQAKVESDREEKDIVAYKSRRWRKQREITALPCRRIRAKFRHDQPVKQITLEFANGRLYLIDFKPGKEIRDTLEAGLGIPYKEKWKDNPRKQCKIWVGVEGLRIIRICSDRGILADLGEWVRQGKRREDVEKLFIEFVTELGLEKEDFGFGGH